MHAVGVDIGGTKCASGIANPQDGMLLSVRSCSMPTSYSGIFSAISGDIGRFAADYGPIDLIGLGVPGTLDAARTMVVKAPNAVALEGQPLRADLEAKFGCPVYMGGDVQASAAAEALYGTGADDPDAELVFASIGTGFGVGLVLRDDAGKRTSRATQYGHVTVVPNGAPCGCKARGCSEAYVTSWGMMRLFGLGSIGEIAALKTDQKALIGEYVGKAVQAAIVGAPDVRNVVFGGTVMVNQPWMLDATRQWLEANLSIVRMPKMVMSPFGASAGVCGCIGMAEMARRQGILV